MREGPTRVGCGGVFIGADCGCAATAGLVIEVVTECWCETGSNEGTAGAGVEIVSSGVYELVGSSRDLDCRVRVSQTARNT